MYIYTVRICAKIRPRYQRYLKKKPRKDIGFRSVEQCETVKGKLFLVRLIRSLFLINFCAFYLIL
jgi:hypothetical protein